MKDYTQGSEELKNSRAKKMMLWFGMVSLGMSFAGFTSSWIVSMTRKDWLKEMELPQAFFISLGVIILSSITMHFAKKSVQQEKQKQGMLLLISTFVLGVVFPVARIS